MMMEYVGDSPAFYMAVMVYEFSSDAASYEPLYEERFVYIKADSEEQAKKKALTHAEQPHSYKNEYEETITWSFKQLVEVLSVWNAESNDGIEFCSRYFRNY